MKKLLLTISCLIVTLLTNAQSPIFQWAKSMVGDSSVSEGFSIDVDASGNIYTTGYFIGTTDFDPGIGIVNLTPVGYNDIFISKLNSSGNFVWVKQMGGTSYEDGRSIKVDASGNVFITGSFNGTVDFNPGLGIFNLTSSGNDDIFITKLDSSGNFVWAKQIGQTSWDQGWSIVLSASGNIYTTGGFLGTVDFDPGPGTFNLTSTGGDLFILKLDPSGSFVWAKNMAGTGSSYSFGNSIDLDASDNVYSTGYFEGTVDFDPGAAIVNLTSVGDVDLFISKLDSVGNFVSVKKIGGFNGDAGSSITVNSSGDVYTTGTFTWTVDFDPGPSIFNLTSGGGGSFSDAFILKLDSFGNFLWAKKMGGTGNAGASSIALDASGNVYTTGGFQYTVDFDPGAGVVNLTAPGVGNQLFISKLDSLGNFLWAQNLGDTLYENGNSIAIDTSGNVYSTGYFSGTADFDPGVGTYNLTASGGYNIFINKWGQTPLGIYQYQTDNNIILYPNPSSNQFYLEYNLSAIEQATFIIYDITGKILFENVLQGGNRTEEIADLNLANGIYLYKIISSDNKILKQSKLIIIK